MRTPLLSIEVDDQPAALVVRFRGEVDITTAPSVRAALSQLG